MEGFDNIGNKLQVGDQVLVLVPKSDATYRYANVLDFRNIYEDRKHCEVLIEYFCDRLYCNKRRWDQRDGKVLFTKKITKAWRSSSDIVKVKQEYIQ